MSETAPSTTPSSHSGSAPSGSKSRKELKEEYKRRKPPMGVFQIRNLQTGRRFVHFANDFDAAFRSQKFQLEMGAHRNEPLQHDWKSSGEQNFAFEIVHDLSYPDDESVNLRQELEALAKLTIEELRSSGAELYNK